MNRDYFTKPIQHSRSAHDYGNSGPIADETAYPVSRRERIVVSIIILATTFIAVGIFA